MSAPIVQNELAEAVIRAASPGGVIYTEGQLYYELCRGRRPPPAADAPPRTSAPAVGFAAFREAFAEFCSQTGRPAGLLREASRPPLALAGREADLTLYGVPRVLLCRDNEIARMLRANGFHLETGCAVIALPQPGPLPPPLAGMVARARRASIFALHDASAKGLAWAAQTSRACRLPRGARFRAVGLRPAHARRLQLAAIREASPDAAKLPAALAPAERAWLAEGWSAEVAAVHPARLLRALRRIVLGTLPVPTPELAQSDAGYMTWP